MRLFSISKEDAGLPEANTVIGRMTLSGEITGQQYQAVERFVGLHETYMKAINAPNSLSAPGGGRMASNDEADTEWRVKAERRYRDARRDIRDAQNYSNGNLYAAIDYLGFRNEYHPHMVGDLRLVSNVLIRHFGLAKAA